MASSVAEGANGNIDEQIAQLVQCKPLSEQEVFFAFMNLHFFVVHHNLVGFAASRCFIWNRDFVMDLI